MMRVKTCFAALAVVRDAETNSMSAFNILEAITAVGLPFFMQNASFLVLWERDADDPQRVAGRLTIAVGNQELSASAVNVDFEANLRNRTVINVNGLIVPSAGHLSFRIVLENGVQAEYVVDVLAPPPNVQVQAQRR
ncbi:MAG: hypothetical protein WCC76_06880 [Candidatus Acidiferrales bacterium]